MKHNRFLVLMLVAVLVLSGISAVVAQDMMEPVDLVMWSQDGDANNDIFASLFETWAEEFAPGSTIDIQGIETEELRNQVLTAGLAGSGLPDLILGPNDAVGVFVDAGLLQPLDDLFDMSVYNGTLAAAILPGGTYGVPLNSGNHLMLMYNKSMVEEAPDTWEELIAVAATFEGDVQGFAYNLNEPFWFLPFVGGFGGAVFDEEGNFVLDTQAWVDAYQFVHDLKFSAEVVPVECDYACADSLFKEGGAAMILNGDWSIGEYLDPEKAPAVGPDNLALAPWPMLENGSRPTPYTSGKFLSIPNTVSGANLEAAVAFATWLTTDAEAVNVHALGTGRLPALLGVEVEDPLLADSAAALATGIGMPANTELRCMWDSVRPNLEGVMNDSVAPADAAVEAQIAAEECLASS